MSFDIELAARLSLEDESGTTSLVWGEHDTKRAVAKTAKAVRFVINIETLLE
jgi:hypothetical protein